jgi:hypothetical protein
MNQSRKVSAPLKLNRLRAVEVDLSHVESLYRELAARVTVVETENDRQDMDIDGVKIYLVALSNKVTGFEDEFSAANIRTDKITTVGFDTDISVGASLLPTTAALVGPIHSVGSETHQWKTVHTEEVMVAGMSLSNTLGGLRGDIEAIEDLNLVQHLKMEGDGLIGVNQNKRDFGALEYPWWTIYTTVITVNDIINANMLKSSRSDTDAISVYANLVPNETDIGGNTTGTDTKPWRTRNFHNVYANNVFGQNEDGASRRALLDGDQNVTSTIIPQADKQVDFGSTTRALSKAQFQDLYGLDASGTPRRALLEGDATEWSEISGKPASKRG